MRLCVCSCACVGVCVCAGRGEWKSFKDRSGRRDEMETNPSSRDSSSPSPTGLQLTDSFDGESCPSPAMPGSACLRGMTHSETSDGLSVPHVYNQSARAWMWSRSTIGCKRALSEQSGEGRNHLWHPHPQCSMLGGRHPKRTSAPQVCVFF